MSDFPGWKISFPVYSSAIGGTVAVIDSGPAVAAGFIPDQKYEFRWVVFHVHDGRRSKKGLSRRTLREAEKLAVALSQGDHQIKLRPLSDKRVYDALPVVIKEPKQEPEPPKDPQKGNKGKSRKRPSTGQKSRARDPSPPPPEDEKKPPAPAPAAKFTQADLNVAVQSHLAEIGMEKIKQVLEESLDAEATIWVDKVVPDENDPEKTKVIKTVEKIPDHKTRIAGGKMILEYLIGRPVERSEVIERKEVDYSEIEKRLEGSSFYRDELRKLLDKLDARAGRKL
jgi:hypothetical protein